MPPINFGSQRTSEKSNRENTDREEYADACKDRTRRWERLHNNVRITIQVVKKIVSMYQANAPTESRRNRGEDIYRRPDADHQSLIAGASSLKSFNLISNYVQDAIDRLAAFHFSGEPVVHKVSLRLFLVVAQGVLKDRFEAHIRVRCLRRRRHGTEEILFMNKDRAGDRKLERARREPNRNPVGNPVECHDR